jgi:hypothetical protein
LTHTQRARTQPEIPICDDPSDAGPEQVATSRARFDPLDDWPSAERIELNKDGQLRPESIAAILTRTSLGSLGCAPQHRAQAAERQPGLQVRAMPSGSESPAKASPI